MQPQNKIPTLFEWAGDMTTFDTLFTAFYDKVLKDDLLKEVFKNMSPEHIKHVSHFVAEVFGGDKLYTTEEWGTRIAIINSQLSQNPLEDHEPMPKWGWGETGGPYQPKEN